MSRVRLALVRYTPDYFLPFASALEQAGFDVYWINALRADVNTLKNAGVPDARILDVEAGFESTASLADCRARLGALEESSPDGPRVHDIVLMDRLLRRKPGEFALRYLDQAAGQVRRFLVDNGIQLVSSGRDTALQLVTMLVCRQLGTPWVVPTRARIPQELFAFGTRHDTEGLVAMREVQSSDRQWAEDTLARFNNRAIQPALKKSARGFGDVLRLLPGHARVFAYEMRRARADRGNAHARYPLPRLMAMYLRRRLNLAVYKLAPPYRAPGDAPFALYALHTQPESSIDVVGSFWSDQVQLVRTIARALPATHELYVKIHPTDVDGQGAAFYRALREVPGVRLIGEGVDTRDLLRRTSLLFALSGTVAYEAGLLGRPVVVFARNYFNALPTIRRCTDPTELPGMVRHQLDAPPPADLHERVIAFLAWLRSCCFDGEVNRTYGASTTGLRDTDLLSLQQAYRVLAARLLDEGHAPCG